MSQETDTLLDKLYPTYDGGYQPPITDGIKVNIPNGGTFVIGPVVCDEPWNYKAKQLAEKHIWAVQYTAGIQWVTAHVLAANMNEAVAICRENDILESTIKSMTKLNSSPVLY